MTQNSKLFKVRQSGYLFETECCLLGKEVLDNVFIRDLLGMKVIPFVDKGKHYQRQHQWQFNGDVVAIRVGEEKNYGIVGATIYFDYSRRLHEPYVAIDDDSGVFESIDVVKDMVERAFKWIFKDTEATVYLEPWDEKIHWYKDCCEAHSHAKLTENIVADEDWDVNTYLKNVIKDLKKKKGASPPKKENTKKKQFVSAVYDKKKLEQVKALINEYLEGATETKDIIMPFRAAIEAGVIRRATWAEIVEGFNLGVKYRSSYYRLTNDSNTTYNGPAFDEIVERFRAL